MMTVYACLLSFLIAGSTCLPQIRPPDIASSTYQETTSLLQYLNPERRTIEAPCTGNTPGNRQQWCDHDLYTDYTTTSPNTGVVQEFWFDLIQASLAPDGRERWTLTINGSIPGPTIIVDWGDTVVIHLRNNLPPSINNGTSLHFHSIRQLNTNPMDGAVSLRQCPIAPGQTMTYRWQATQYGTTWYHSHMGLQTWEGVFGGMIINGPASANYDEDKRVILLNDWDVRTVDELWDNVKLSGPPTVDNALINGSNVFGEDGMDQVGRRFEMPFTKGKSYRPRLVNAACDMHFKFSIDHHSLLVPQLSCSQVLNPDNIRGIIYYDDEESAGPIKIPNSTAHNFPDSCRDEDPSNIIPIISHPFDLTPSQLYYNETLPVTIGMTKSFYHGQLNGTFFSHNWTQPTLRSLYHSKESQKSNLDPRSNSCVNSLFLPDNSILVTQPETWVLIIIESTLPATHPIHLHGHDFLILSQELGPYTGSTPTSIPPSTPKRDTERYYQQGDIW